MMTIFMLAFVTVSCRRGTETPKIHTTVDQTAIDYFNWKPGSYWIFNDSITGKVDSFNVDDYSFSTYTTGDNILCDLIRISIREYYDTSTVYKLWQIELDAFTRGIALNYYDLPLHFAGALYYNIDPFVLTGGRTILPSVTVAAKSYNSVLGSTTLTDTLLLNADSGLIKISLNNQYAQKNLILQKSHIVH